MELCGSSRAPLFFEHAIATLTGTPAPSFSLAPEKRELRPPDDYLRQVMAELKIVRLSYQVRIALGVYLMGGLSLE